MNLLLVKIRMGFIAFTGRVTLKMKATEFHLISFQRTVRTLYNLLPNDEKWDLDEK